MKERYIKGFNVDSTLKNLLHGHEYKLNTCFMIRVQYLI